ncbi:MAG: hypothetical protein RL209_492, partial [Pseudomonadota bacterium]
MHHPNIARRTRPSGVGESMLLAPPLKRVFSKESSGLNSPPIGDSALRPRIKAENYALCGVALPTGADLPRPAFGMAVPTVGMDEGLTTLP